jgi:hypothetical protein
MLNLQKLTIEYFVEELRKAYRRTYSDIQAQFGNIIAWSGRLALENISNSDALYHNVDHTVMVTLAGQAIIEGKHLCEGGVVPRDWMHFIIALLCHDIGYVKGVCRGDEGEMFATGIGDERVRIPPGGTDVALTPYHVNRSKLFVLERFSSKRQVDVATHIDAKVITSYIEMTRFPVPDDERYQYTKGYGGLVRAADFIGQLGDPNHLRKCAALFYEFEEIGGNEQHGYQRPGDVRKGYARFYWEVVRPYIGDALHYLRMTHEGKKWIASLYANVFASEHDKI